MTVHKALLASALTVLLALGGVACDQNAEDGGTETPDTPAQTEGGES